jgi:ribonuclease E
MFGEKPADLDVFGLGREGETPRREPAAGRDRAEDESGSVLEYDQPEGSGSDLPLGAGPQGEAGTRGEERPDREGRRRRRRRGRGRRGAGEGREPAAPRHEADIEPAGEEADFDFERDAELDLEADLGDERDTSRQPPERQPPERQPSERQPRRERAEEPDRYPPSGERAGRESDERGDRPRRRRRRGGGRDRDEGAAQRPAPFGAEADELRPYGRSAEQRPPASRTARAADEEPDDDLLDVTDEGDEGEGGDVPTHKKIPTWDEAVGILIDANMANRGPDRDRGRGRGRGRR